MSSQIMMWSDQVEGNEEGYESEQVEQYGDDDLLGPGDSASQVSESYSAYCIDDMFGLPSVLSVPSNLSFKVTAGGKVPAYYYKVLQDADVRALNILWAAYDFLEDLFETKALANRPGDPIACEELIELARIRKRDGFSEFDLNEWMNRILFKLLDRLHPHCFVLMKPEPWNVWPEELGPHAHSLSQPTIDAIVAVNPKHPAAIPSRASPHPLSEEAMRQLLTDDNLLKALRKCTVAAENSSSIHDMSMIKFKSAGHWIKRGKMSTEMNIARAEVVNGSLFQLASMVELMKLAKLPKDDKALPSYFVLAMTICGEEWTVECTMRERPESKRTVFNTLAHGNWANNPSLFLSAFTEVLEQSIPYMEEKAARLAVLYSQIKPADRQIGPTDSRQRSRMRTRATSLPNPSLSQSAVPAISSIVDPDLANIDPDETDVSESRLMDLAVNTRAPSDQQ